MLSTIQKTILRLSPQCSISHRGDAYKIEFLKAATVLCKRAKRPLFYVATHQSSYQQLYGGLESALKLYTEANLEKNLQKGSLCRCSNQKKRLCRETMLDSSARGTETSDSVMRKRCHLLKFKDVLIVKH